jgi:hypothetical protein
MRKVFFRFSGGPMDGKRVSGSPGGRGEAHHYYSITHHGRVGQRFRTASQYAINTLAREGLGGDRPHRFQPHLYEVVDRIENGDIVLVRIQYVPQDVAELEA